MGLAQPSDPPMAAGNNRLADILNASLDPRTNKEGLSLSRRPLHGQKLTDSSSGACTKARGEAARFFCDPLADCRNT